MREMQLLLRPLYAGLLVSLVLLGACRDGLIGPSGPEVAGLRVSANVAGTPISTVVLTVSATDIPTPLAFNLEIENGVASGTLQVPTGLARTFAATAFAANGEVTHEGSATADVRRGENPPLQLVLEPITGQQPVIISVATYSVEVTPAEAHLPLGRTLLLTATVRDAEGRVMPRQVVWASLNPALATVSSAGLVTTHQPGEVQIVASYAGVAGIARIIIHAPAPTPGQIAFRSDRDGSPEIYVMDEDGSNVRRLASHPQPLFYPAWSPDGRITFGSFAGGSGGIYVMNADGSNVQRLTHNPGGMDREAAWSMDGERIVFISDRATAPIRFNIHVMNADGSNIQRLTQVGTDNRPSWFPDGTRILFGSNRDGNSDIYVMDADGSNVQRLTDHTATDESPAVSPDGSRIVFHSSRDGNGEIYVMDADGSNVQRLTDHPAADFYPSWSPDGSRIVFGSNRDGNAEIYVMNADGSNVRRLTENPGSDVGPAWRP